MRWHGGIDSGEDASFCAASELSSYQNRRHNLYSSEELIKVLRAISDKVNNEANVRNQRSGTTIAMLTIKGNMCCLANVGDSRIYVLRNKILKQISVDHSEIQRLISKGMVTLTDAKTHPRRHAINQYLGMPKEIRVSPSIRQDVVLEAGDLYLLCSDGLTDMVDNNVIEKILNEMTSVEDGVRELVYEALRNGGRDNITALLVCVVRTKLKLKFWDVVKRSQVIAVLLTCAQIVIGGGLLLTLIDFIYLLMNN